MDATKTEFRISRWDFGLSQSRRVRPRAKQPRAKQSQATPNGDGVPPPCRSTREINWILFTDSSQSAAGRRARLALLKLYLRARDGKDVRRWIEGEFSSVREGH